MVGRETAAAPPAAARAPGAASVLSVRGLTLDVPGRRGWRRVLDGVDFDLQRRRGARHRRPARLRPHRDPRDAVRRRRGPRRRRRSASTAAPVDDRLARAPRAASASRSSPRTARRKGLHLDASIRDNVALPSLGRISPLRHPPPGAARRPSPRDAVRRLGVRCSGIEQVAATLSGGNQQKVVIGKWLATGPRVLLLDEPTRGIDVGAKQEIYALVRALAGRGPRHPHGQLRAARAPAPRRPHPRHVPRAAQTGDARPRRGERGGDHAPRRARVTRARLVMLLRLLARTKLYWGLAAIFLIGVLTSPVTSKGNNIFLSYGNLLDVLRQVSITGLIATGMTAVILTAGIDLSVGSIMALCSVVCAMLLTVPGWTPAAAMGMPALALDRLRRPRRPRPASSSAASPPPAAAGRRAEARLDTARGVVLPARRRRRRRRRSSLWFTVPQVATKFGVLGVLLVAPCVGLLFGAINGIVIVGGRLQPFIVTLAMMVTALGVARLTAGPEQRRAAGLHRHERRRRVRRAAQPRLRRRAGPRPLLPRRRADLRRGAALHLLRPLRLRDRRQRGGGAPLRHRRRRHQDRHLRHLRHARRRRRGALRRAVPPGQARRRQPASSSTPSPRWSSAAPA